MLEEASRLNQLVDRVLLPAQVDGESGPLQLTAAPVRDVISQVTELLGVVAEGR